MSTVVDASNSIIRSIDLDGVRSRYQSAQPFPFFVIDNFLSEDFAQEVLDAYPTYDQARQMGGIEFAAVNERLKIQITDSGSFPSPVKRLSDALSSRDFLQKMEYITGIPRLLADPAFNGGGMHLSGPGGRLDVHVDFNLLNGGKLHRRLNILVYLNRTWDKAWGGEIELWDREVKNCAHSLAPLFNRCVVFETSDISFHGVRPITCPVGNVRRSFAAYYYTEEAPAAWDGRSHSTIFRARPDEKVRGAILMPAERLRDGLSDGVRVVKDAIKRLVGRS